VGGVEGEEAGPEQGQEPGPTRRVLGSGRRRRRRHTVLGPVVTGGVKIVVVRRWGVEHRRVGAGYWGHQVLTLSPL
jgi:hypothetical protein